ncbi:hypothetical protein [Niallia taxi]|uniref:hypothetical protein n=2 Tax=Niallia taxi TaxID=2499688 RepID=UPI002E22FEAE|nr:hypothetical protein [Niallia taxi]
MKTIIWGKLKGQSIKKEGVRMNKSLILLDIQTLNNELSNNRKRSIKIIKRLQQEPTNLMLKRRLKKIKLDNENISKKQNELWKLYKEK